MHITTISLQNYRNYENLNLSLNPGVNILYGRNAQGKTNLLEALYLCATGRSKRASTDKELVMFGKNEAHVQLMLEKDGLNDRLDVHLKREGKKGVAINGLPVKRLGDLFGSLYAVVFSPEDLQLIKAGPSERRRFLDMEICQLSSVYYYELWQYYKVLKQRNSLLKDIQRKKCDEDMLFVWDEQLLNHGIRIMAKRREFVEMLNGFAGGVHNRVTDGCECLEIRYKPSVSEDEYSQRLKKNIQRDILLGSTSVGIHKDDVSFFINDTDVRVFGSQGQQRTAALSAKLAQIELIRAEKNTNPVLLLDDVFSELDKSRQSHLVDYISGVQTIITATGVEGILNSMMDKKNISVFEVKNGKIFLTN